MFSKIVKTLIIFLAALHMQAGNALATSTASNFGNSCVPPTIQGNSTYLAKTAYGYIQSNISMPCTPCIASSASPSGACQDIAPSNLTLCIRSTPAPNSNTCIPVTLTANQTVAINTASNSGISGSFISSGSAATGAGIVNATVKSYASSNQLCLTMMTPSGQIPLLCKSTIANAANNLGQRDLPSCPTLTAACYGTSRHTQSPFSFSGQAYECLTGSLDNIFFQTNSCIDPTDQTNSNLLSSYFTFQNALRVGIGAAMIIYVIFFGIRMALGEEKVSLSSFSMGAIKLILVAYFAIGLGPLQYANNQIQSTNNGMIDVAKPLLTQAMTDFAQIVFNAGESSGLCAFDITKYESGYNYYALFDAIDCRIAYYLGMQAISSQLGSAEVSGSTSAGQEWNWAPTNSSGPAQLGMTNTEFFGYFFMLFGLLLGGNLVMLIFSLVFLIIFLGIVLHFISSFLICVVTLYVMIYISPIFITFALFNRTKGYFDSWLKISVSCALQPAILAGFLALVITMFDSGMYNTCNFNRHTYEVASSNVSSTSYISTFGLVVPASEDPNTGACASSVGYKMMRYYQGDGWNSLGLILFTVYFIDGFSNQILAIEDLTALAMMCIIFYFFSSSMSDFAAELTGGPNMKGVTVSASMVVGAIADKANGAYNKAKAAASQVADKVKGGGGGTKDSGSGGAARAGDKAAGGGGKAGDSGGGGKDGGSGGAAKAGDKAAGGGGKAGDSGGGGS